MNMTRATATNVDGQPAVNAAGQAATQQGVPLNDADVAALANDALDAACQVIQSALGVEYGDNASIFFSDDLVLSTFSAYIHAELQDRADSINGTFNVLGKDRKC